METSDNDEASQQRGHLELLCQMAIMQDHDQIIQNPIVAEPALETSSLKGSIQVDQIKPLPALLSEPGSPSGDHHIVHLFNPKDSSQLVPSSIPFLNKMESSSIVQGSRRPNKSSAPGSSHFSNDRTENRTLNITDCGKLGSIQSSIKLHYCHKDLIRENVQLKIELGDAKKEIAKLKKEMNRASCNISELRSLSGGNKISEIPLADMIEIMQEYGSEVSGQSFQKRKEDPQPASIVRQFRRWNPDFLKYFCRKNGKWVPKLGKAGELQRRQLKREALKAHRRNPPHGTSDQKSLIICERTGHTQC